MHAGPNLLRDSFFYSLQILAKCQFIWSRKNLKIQIVYNFVTSINLLSKLRNYFKQTFCIKIELQHVAFIHLRPSIHIRNLSNIILVILLQRHLIKFNYFYISWRKIILSFRRKLNNFLLLLNCYVKCFVNFDLLRLRYSFNFFLHN